MSRAQEWLVSRLMTSDFMFWAAKEVLPEEMIGFLLPTDPALLSQVPESERRRAYAILDQILPISRRWRGMQNDAKLAGHPTRVDFARLRVPLLLLPAEDDRFGTAPTARAIAQQVQGARLVVFETGGHILLGCHQDSAAEIVRFVREDSNLGSRPGPLRERQLSLADASKPPVCFRPGCVIRGSILIDVILHANPRAPAAALSLCRNPRLYPMGVATVNSPGKVVRLFNDLEC